MKVLITLRVMRFPHAAREEYTPLSATANDLCGPKQNSIAPKQMAMNREAQLRQENMTARSIVTRFRDCFVMRHASFGESFVAGRWSFHKSLAMGAWSLVIWFFAACLLSGLGVAAQSAVAAENPMLLLHALQEHGYGDMAVEYLNQLRGRPDLPAELRDVWDLEMSKSLRAAAGDAFNAEEFESLNAEAQKSLEKFLKEKPNHPETVLAMAASGNFAMDRALKLIRTAQSTTDANQQAKLYADARTTLQETRPRFKEAAEKLRARLSALPSPSKQQNKRPTGREKESEREDVETSMQDAYFQMALCDYYVAQTYTDPRNRTRQDMLRTAAKDFDAIYQTNRLNSVGLYAHMWHGKATEQLGDVQTALDIYDEVLANQPEPGQPRDAKLESLFAEVEHSRLQLVAKRAPEKFMSEATEWLNTYAKTKETKATNAYQAIALDVAKRQLAAAEQATDRRQKEKGISAALAILAEMAKVPSQYQQQAILLHLKYAKAGVAAPETSDQLVALAEVAETAGKWEDAIASYTQALELADRIKGKDPERVSAVRDALARALYIQALQQYNKGKFDDCLAAAGKVIHGYGTSPAGPWAGSLAVSAAFDLYAAAPVKAKPAALDRLQKVANVVLSTWPGKPEADDARMHLARVSLLEGKTEEALKIFESVNEKSQRYPMALDWAGRICFDRYLAEKKKPADSQNQQQMTADRAKAVKLLGDSLEVQRKKTEPARPFPRQLIATQLALAEIALEGNDAAQAAVLLQPLIGPAKGNRGEEIDSTALAVFVSAVRVYDKLNDAAKVAEVGMALAESGADAANVNAALLECARMLNLRRKQAEAAVTEATAGSDGKKLGAAQAKLAASKDLLAKLLEKLTGRQQLSAAEMLFIADACTAADLDDAAREQYLRIAKRLESDPQFAKAAGKAVVRVRTQLVGLLSKEGKYEEALRQVTQLVAENPSKLEPLMEQGHILQALAEKNSAYLKDAVSHWNKLCDAMQRMPKRPPEYFEVTYHLAYCLYRQASNAADKTTATEKAKQAQKLLKSALMLSPSLNGPEMVTQYNALLQKITALQSRLPPAGQSPAGKTAPAAKKKP